MNGKGLDVSSAMVGGFDDPGRGGGEGGGGIRDAKGLITEKGNWNIAARIPGCTYKGCWWRGMLNERSDDGRILTRP